MSGGSISVRCHTANDSISSTAYYLVPSIFPSFVPRSLMIINKYISLSIHCVIGRPGRGSKLTGQDKTGKKKQTVERLDEEWMGRMNIHHHHHHHSNNNNHISNCFFPVSWATAAGEKEEKKVNSRESIWSETDADRNRLGSSSRLNTNEADKQ